MRTHGPGKYDDECALIKGMTLARGVLLVVVGGEHGNGVSMKIDDPTIAAMVPAMLEGLAAQIRADLAVK